MRALERSRETRFTQGRLNFRPVQIRECAKPFGIDFLGKLNLRPAGRKAGWGSTLLGLIVAAKM
jgi:hypothetical protein